MSDDEREVDSGPFCRHYADPADCDEKCARCGHPCWLHNEDDCDGGPVDFDCPCTGFVESEPTEGASAVS